MTISLLPVKPIPTGVANGDLDTLMRKIGAAPGPSDGTNGYFGSQLQGFFDIPQAGFFRFEMPVVAGETIVGVKLKLRSSSSAGASTVLSIGLCKRQETANAWENANGVLEWTIENHIPFAIFNSFIGVLFDPSVWYGGAPPIELETLANSLSGSNWAISEGTLSAGSPGPVTGLLDQLQSYLDDPANEATRGSTEAGSIPIMIQIAGLYPGVRNNYQGFRTSDHSVESTRPTLELESTSSDPSEIDVKLEGHPSVKVRANATPTASVKQAAGETGSGKPRARATVSANLKAKPTGDP